MDILAHSITRKQNGFEHSIAFDFEGKNFEALVVETADETYVAECYWLHGRGLVEIDIPEFFGKGFSSDVFNLIYSEVEKVDHDANDERDDESE